MDHFTIINYSSFFRSKLFVIALRKHVISLNNSMLLKQLLTGSGISFFFQNSMLKPVSDTSIKSSH